MRHSYTSFTNRMVAFLDAQEDSVVQPFLDSLMLDDDLDIPGHSCPDAIDAGMADIVRLARIA